MNKKPLIRLFDIETFPMLNWNWGHWQQDSLKTEKHWELASFAYKELGKDGITCISRQDFKDPTDSSLTKSLFKLIDESDVLIAHNGDEFDIKKSNSKFAQHKLGVPTPGQSIDTKKIAKKHFGFTSNSLNDLADFLSIGRKKETGGKELWFKCMAGDKKAWSTMCEYNKHDVVLLEKVYDRLKPWATDHPNLALLSGQHGACPKCGDTRLRSRGHIVKKTTSYLLLKCQGCMSYVRSRTSEKGVKSLYVAA